MLARDTIRIVAGFSSGKVMTSQKIRSVFLTGYTCYENLQSSARLDQLKRIEVRIGAVLGARQAHKYPHLCTGIQRDKKIGPGKIDVNFTSKKYLGSMTDLRVGTIGLKRSRCLGSEQTAAETE